MPASASVEPRPVFGVSRSGWGEEPEAPAILSPAHTSQRDVAAVRARDAPLFAEPRSLAFLSCGNPYELEQDCSNWSGPKRKISIAGVELKIAGSADGTRVLIAPPSRYLAADTAILNAKTDEIYRVVRGALLERGVTIQRIVPFRSLGVLAAYGFEFEGDGYAVLKDYSL